MVRALSRCLKMYNSALIGFIALQVFHDHCAPHPVWVNQKLSLKTKRNPIYVTVILCLRAYALHAGNQAVKWLLASIILVSIRLNSTCLEGILFADGSTGTALLRNRGLLAQLSRGQVYVSYHVLPGGMETHSWRSLDPVGPAPLWVYPLDYRTLNWSDGCFSGGFSCLLTVSSLPTKAGLINYATQTAFDGIIFLVSAVKLVKLSAFSIQCCDRMKCNSNSIFVVLTGRSQLAWLLLQDCAFCSTLPLTKDMKSDFLMRSTRLSLLAHLVRDDLQYDDWSKTSLTYNS